MSASLLALESVTAAYGRLPVLHDVSLQVRPGDIVSLIGANGAGKSTTMMTICGRPRASRGRVLFDGADITRCPTHEIARLGICQAPEGRRIFGRMTVMENLQMGAIVANAPDGFEADLARVFALFPRLKDRASQRGGTLSGGEQQMLAIARALMGRPKLLLLDEPSLGLAPLVVKQIFEAIKALNADGLTVFLVEQNAYHALKLADRGYVMVNGRITMTGTGAELLASEDVRSAYLDGAASEAEEPVSS
ncbi:ABC transporter ATP-binding protein [Methyloceanibacter methanicus]|uniref:ABC transporter ATP-binding protein n=1 Tax=Methyloceanibacter methanicus TaxID=1774968 RepID=A0A1E3VZA6_9HYPH|nr:ABC transporter ATP-binding protein [Methyloceanibacter methanicus]ODR98843.1 ABC transporter ATP-binding protein [Methyloceanibacter methanicus]